MISVSALPHYSWGGMLTLSFIGHKRITYDIQHFLPRLLGYLVGIGRPSQAFPSLEPYVPLSWHTAQTLFTTINLISATKGCASFHSLYWTILYPCKGIMSLLSKNVINWLISFLLEMFSWYVTLRVLPISRSQPLVAISLEHSERSLIYVWLILVIACLYVRCKSYIFLDLSKMNHHSTTRRVSVRRCLINPTIQLSISSFPELYKAIKSRPPVSSPIEAKYSDLYFTTPSGRPEVVLARRPLRATVERSTTSGRWGESETTSGRAKVGVCVVFHRRY
jgi:hypothetical protein